MVILVCIDDKEEWEFFLVFDFSLMILKENLYSNGGDVLCIDIYVYDNNKLMIYIILQEFYGQSLIYEMIFFYFGNEVILVDENGNIVIYILGSVGYVIECIYKLFDQVRKYIFIYFGEYFIWIDEEINSMFYFFVELVYDDNGNLSYIIVNGL